VTIDPLLLKVLYDDILVSKAVLLLGENSGLNIINVIITINANNASKDAIKHTYKLT
jgi:hypothetical protein